MFAARKRFPKRKLEESRSGSESVKEETEVKEDQLQQNKRPRVESSPVRPGTWSPLLMEQLPTRSLNALVRVKKHRELVFNRILNFLKRKKSLTSGFSYAQYHEHCCVHWDYVL